MNTPHTRFPWSPVACLLLPALAACSGASASGGGDGDAALSGPRPAEAGAPDVVIIGADAGPEGMADGTVADATTDGMAAQDATQDALLADGGVDDVDAAV